MLSDEEGEKINKIDKKREERDTHQQTHFELKEMHREKQESTQEPKKENPCMGPSVKLNDGKKKELNDLGPKLNGPSHKWKVYTRNKGCNKQMEPIDKLHLHKGQKSQIDSKQKK